MTNFEIIFFQIRPWFPVQWGVNMNNADADPKNCLQTGGGYGEVLIKLRFFSISNKQHSSPSDLVVGCALTDFGWLWRRCGWLQQFWTFHHLHFGQTEVGSRICFMTFKHHPEIFLTSSWSLPNVILKSSWRQPDAFLTSSGSLPNVILKSSVFSLYSQ